jgi:uncharacterized protein YcfJ
MCTLVLGSQAMAQMVLYEREGFRGRSVVVDRDMRNLDRRGLGDKANSIVVERGRWEVCEEPRFQGRCVVLRRGSYDSLRQVGMGRHVASARPLDDRRRYDNEIAAPAERPDYAYRRRPTERVFDAPVTQVRAVVGPPNQQCWVERQQVQQPGQPNVGGAVAGALIGGILGHQVGKGSGRDAATAAGVVGGAAIGANTGGGSTGGVGYQDVQRCQQVPAAAPAYYDVTYNFRGMEHHIQMSAPPGPTIVVNERGEPRQ